EKREKEQEMNCKIILFLFLLFTMPVIANGQFIDVGSQQIRLKAGLPSVFTISNVRQISGSEGEAVLSVTITLKNGRVESVGKDGAYWIITVRNSSKSASTYVIKDSQFKIVGEESKKVIVNSIHWKDGN
ncbi:MAG: hypothetical protein NUV76_06040, partial [Candidatus Kuenenia sp.]|nr:hypothetical protein [Candidatus Kuenenia sp.]